MSEEPFEPERVVCGEPCRKMGCREHGAVWKRCKHSGKEWRGFPVFPLMSSGGFFDDVKIVDAWERRARAIVGCDCPDCMSDERVPGAFQGCMQCDADLRGLTLHHCPSMLPVATE